jgi:hypothetical protein
MTDRDELNAILTKARAHREKATNDGVARIAYEFVAYRYLDLVFEWLDANKETK